MISFMKTKHKRESSKIIAKKNSIDVDHGTELITGSKSAKTIGVWFDNLVSTVLNF